MDSTEIRELRKSLGLTQKELAARLKVDSITVSRWERNEQRPSSLAQKQLARLVNKIAKQEATEEVTSVA
ncbi:hypothetical protein ES703_00116 [subsurface metagenome]